MLRTKCLQETPGIGKIYMVPIVLFQFFLASKTLLLALDLNVHRLFALIQSKQQLELLGQSLLLL